MDTMTEQKKTPKTKYPPMQIWDVYTRLTVISERLIDGDYKKRLCRCICSKEKLIVEDHLLSKNSQSCGCLAIELSKARAKPRVGKPKRSSSPAGFPCKGCGRPCLHQSELCGTCRKVDCSGCGRRFMPSVVGDKNCAPCKKAKQRPTRGMW